MMLKKTKRAVGSAMAGSIILAAVMLVAGCSSMQNALANALTKQPEPAPAPAPQEQPAPAPAPKTASPGAAMAYQYQFNAFYGGMWNMGWFGYGDANYKVGQGTVWTFVDTDSKGKKKDKDSVSFERALLKINPDKSQWWRFKMDSGKDSILYEFLVGADTVVQKVRYQDPEGTIGEFYPEKGQKQAQPASDAPTSRAEMPKYLVDKQTVQVKAGSFMTDHYLYTDEKGRGTSESWVSDKVPGYLVKSMYAGKKDNKTATGELVQILSGVKTTLSSY
jgi:hypothetical protein